MLENELFLYKLNRFMIKHDNIGVGVFLGFEDGKIGVYFENGLKLWFKEDVFTNNELKFVKPTSNQENKQIYQKVLSNKEKYDWSYAEDLLCCCLFAKFYIINKRRNMNSVIIEMLQSIFPYLKASSIIYKLKNITYICKKLGVEFSEEIYPCENYSEQNYCAMLKILKDLGIKNN